MSEVRVGSITFGPRQETFDRQIRALKDIASPRAISIALEARYASLIDDALKLIRADRVPEAVEVLEKARRISR